ncbi:hypothetical protein [Streptomyces sp. GQFP]|uniref:hypothetical protein n=1 Tax=Streptomyces sp. GQFP TaxID=2907545 RepID=UPI001F15ABA2|nr:hypothetical protein [Streptomyces sp. GQFP]UIX29423.1 hypothetical protein LUX31_04865 [Streptomyces sp. GQFP]
MRLGAYPAVPHDKPLAEAPAAPREPGLPGTEIDSDGFGPAPRLPAAGIRTRQGGVPRAVPGVRHHPDRAPLRRQPAPADSTTITIENA